LILRRPGTEFREPIEGFEGAVAVCRQPDAATASEIMDVIDEETKLTDSPSRDIKSASRVFGKVFTFIDTGEEVFPIEENGNGCLKEECLGTIAPITAQLWDILFGMIRLKGDDRKNSE